MWGVSQRVRRGVFAAISVMQLGCSDVASTTDAQSENSTQVRTIETAELQVLQLQALAGDVEASSRVAVHWQAQGDGLHFSDEQLFWLQVAAENGDPVTMLNYGLALSWTGEPNKCRRALYWIRRWATTDDVPPEQIDVDGVTYWEKEVIQRLDDCT
jgi:hypothetical protein